MSDRIVRNAGRIANRLVRLTDKFRFGRGAAPGNSDSAAAAAFAEAAASYRAAYEKLQKYKSPPVDDLSRSAYPWPDWGARLAREFSETVPPDFIQHPTIKETMVFHGRLCNSGRLASVRREFNEALSRQLLAEDPVGGPSICNATLNTSSNRLYHAFHLAQYRETTGKPFFEQGVVCEWGGGYGDMARLLWRLGQAAEGRTIILIDLPAVGALQWVYLTAVLGASAVTIVEKPEQEIATGCVNIMNSCVAFAKPGLKAACLVSTWALSESPHRLQAEVVRRQFFGASNILLAFSLDADNMIAGPLRENGAVIRAVPFLTMDGYAPSSYGFR